MRRDGGDAETGMGVDLGGSLRYADAALGLTAEAGGRYLAAHEDAGYREWGADAAGGAERLWSARDARGLAGHGFDAAMRLRAEVGYGLPAFRGRGGVTPFAGVSTTAFGRDWRAGALWRRGPALEMALEATRGEAAGERPAHGVLFRLTWRPGRAGVPAPRGGARPAPGRGLPRRREAGRRRAGKTSWCARSTTALRRAYAPATTCTWTRTSRPSTAASCCSAAARTRWCGGWSWKRTAAASPAAAGSPRLSRVFSHLRAGIRFAGSRIRSGRRVGGNGLQCKRLRRSGCRPGAEDRTPRGGPGGRILI